MPEAKVEVSGPALVRAQTITTDSFGNYVFSALPLGTYTITATATGFRQMKLADIVPQVGRLLSAEIKLEVGAVTESVVVTAAAGLLDVSQSTSAANVNVGFFDWLPKSRSFGGLIELAAGVPPELTLSPLPSLLKGTSASLRNRLDPWGKPPAPALREMPRGWQRLKHFNETWPPAIRPGHARMLEQRI